MGYSGEQEIQLYRLLSVTERSVHCSMFSRVSKELVARKGKQLEDDKNRRKTSHKKAIEEEKGLQKWPIYNR